MSGEFAGLRSFGMLVGIAKLMFGSFSHRFRLWELCLYAEGLKLEGPQVRKNQLSGLGFYQPNSCCDPTDKERIFNFF